MIFAKRVVMSVTSNSNSLPTIWRKRDPFQPVFFCAIFTVILRFFWWCFGKSTKQTDTSEGKTLANFCQNSMQTTPIIGCYTNHFSAVCRDVVRPNHQKYFVWAPGANWTFDFIVIFFAPSAFIVVCGIWTIYNPVRGNTQYYASTSLIVQRQYQDCGIQASWMLALFSFNRHACCVIFFCRCLFSVSRFVSCAGFSCRGSSTLKDSASAIACALPGHCTQLDCCFSALKNYWWEGTPLAAPIYYTYGEGGDSICHLRGRGPLRHPLQNLIVFEMLWVVTLPFDCASRLYFPANLLPTTD